MKQTRKKTYSGPLDAQGVADGMNAALRNSKRLAADASILLDAGRYPSACSLAVLAIEEAGKCSVLRGLCLDPSPKALADAWRAYHSHRSKNGMWILPAMAAAGARTLTDFAKVVDADSEHTETLDRLKQLGFYTDCFREGYWFEPSAEIDRNLATQIVEIAELLCRSNEVTVREIELWIEHLRPVWNTPEMNHALVRFASAMESEGLGNHTAADVVTFLFGSEMPPQRAIKPKRH